ncbi:hypothetical protein NDU88_007152 [Pleurodeles waltl]|uniref:Uncharacterized protein n=1 Tax=Pleurodeles waltl TaxID=8319 RepID=A0AAV7NS90_PLEWA|nr:hypothetical protein NDU88_007152 [Pleurodeles waltl]
MLHWQRGTDPEPCQQRGPHLQRRLCACGPLRLETPVRSDSLLQDRQKEVWPTVLMTRWGIPCLQHPRIASNSATPKFCRCCKGLPLLEACIAHKQKHIHHNCYGEKKKNSSLEQIQQTKKDKHSRRQTQSARTLKKRERAR